LVSKPYGKEEDKMDIPAICIFAQVNQTIPPNIGLYDAFRTSISPILFDVGKTLVWCSVAYGTYYVIQMRFTEGINRIKWALIGYIILRTTDAFMTITDTIANNISNNIKF
jgi:hypothetical protein